MVSGANAGDYISYANELDLDDTYELSAGVTPGQLIVSTDDNVNFRISGNSELGEPGARVYMDSCLTLMCSTGCVVEALIWVEVNAQGHVAEVFVMPLASLTAKLGYTLIGIDRDLVMQKYAELSCVSFARDTKITLASGAQKLIQDLTVGDHVLTRYDGVQPIRWIGQSTVRALGEFAPVRIKAGVLHNTNDLIVSPDHRLFIYQRSDAIGAGRSEVLVRARHLVNGSTVVQQDGGFVEYFQLVFDQHQIIYAEGIAAETLMINSQTRAALPTELDQTFPGVLHEHRPHHDFEIPKELLNHADAANLLKRASTM
ncbi:Hint domain-containing protein [Roseovarius sp. EL26]|uniref:Hint domain-containing protein n=1 Tax=Roseovarius sp. EL26 TaxID=2126672 RepID=UPI00349F6542